MKRYVFPILPATAEGRGVMTESNTHPLEVSQQQRIKDVEHLKLLSIFHYVFGGLVALGSSIALIHFFIGLSIVLHPDWLKGDQSAPGLNFIGWMFTGIGALVVLSGWTFGGLTVYSGWLIQCRRQPLFSKVIAAINCMQLPLGTALGIYTLLVLMRPSVVELYETPKRLASSEYGALKA